MDHVLVSNRDSNDQFGILWYNNIKAYLKNNYFKLNTRKKSTEAYKQHLCYSQYIKFDQQNNMLIKLYLYPYIFLFILLIWISFSLLWNINIYICIYMYIYILNYISIAFEVDASSVVATQPFPPASWCVRGLLSSLHPLRKGGTTSAASMLRSCWRGGWRNKSLPSYSHTLSHTHSWYTPRSKQLIEK